MIRHDHVIAVVSSSRLLRALEWLFERASAAWVSSASRRALVALVSGPDARASHPVRLAGCAALSATAVHVSLVGFATLLEPPMAGVGWIAAVPLAVVCIWRPDAVVTAWNRRRRRGTGAARADLS